MSEQPVDAKRRQQLVPGLIGMSVHTDCVYLQEINRANLPEGAEPQVSSIKMVLQAIDFGQLIADVRSGRQDEAETSIRQALAAVQRAGVDFLVVTANTVSAMLDGMPDAVSVPVWTSPRRSSPRRGNKGCPGWVCSAPRKPQGRASTRTARRSLGARSSPRRRDCRGRR